MRKHERRKENFDVWSIFSHSNYKQLAFIVVPIQSIERDGFSFKNVMDFNRTFGSSWVLRQDVLIASTWIVYDNSGTFGLICKNVHVIRTINLLNTKVIQQHHNIAFDVLRWLTRCFDAQNVVLPKRLANILFICIFHVVVNLVNKFCFHCHFATLRQVSNIVLSWICTHPCLIFLWNYMIQGVSHQINRNSQPFRFIETTEQASFNTQIWGCMLTNIRILIWKFTPMCIAITKKNIINPFGRPVRSTLLLYKKHKYKRINSKVRICLCLSFAFSILFCQYIHWQEPRVILRNMYVVANWILEIYFFARQLRIIEKI